MLELLLLDDVLAPFEEPPEDFPRVERDALFDLRAVVAAFFVPADAAFLVVEAAFLVLEAAFFVVDAAFFVVEPDDDERDVDVPLEARDVVRFVPLDERADDERDVLRDDDERVVEPGALRSLAGISARTTDLTSLSIWPSRNFCIRSSWRRWSFASCAVSLSSSALAADSITL